MAHGARVEVIWLKPPTRLQGSAVVCSVCASLVPSTDKAKGQHLHFHDTHEGFLSVRQAEPHLPPDNGPDA